MALSSENEKAAGSVEAVLHYLVATGEKPVSYITEPGSGPVRRKAQYAKHAMAIRDGRAASDRPNLDREGFTLVDHDTAIADFYDEAAVRTDY